MGKIKRIQKGAVNTILLKRGFNLIFLSTRRTTMACHIPESPINQTVAVAIMIMPKIFEPIAPAPKKSNPFSKTRKAVDGVFFFILSANGEDDHAVKRSVTELIILHDMFVVV